MVPRLVHASTLEELTLTPFHLSSASGMKRVIRGVREHPTRSQLIDVPTWADDRWMETRMMAAALQLSTPVAVVSHQSAARLSGWALPLHLERDRRVHVTTEVSVVRRPEFVGHRQRGLVVDRVSGVNVAGRDEALRHVSGLMAEDDLPALLEGLAAGGTVWVPARPARGHSAGSRPARRLVEALPWEGAAPPCEPACPSGRPISARNGLAPGDHVLRTAGAGGRTPCHPRGEDLPP